MKYQPLRRFSRIALAAIIVAQCVPSSSASGHGAHQFKAASVHPASIISLSVLGDFDGDRRLDQAELHLAGAHRCVRVRFGNWRETHLELAVTPQMRGAGALLTRDINQDNKPDLIWVYHSQSEPTEVWLGDGLGHFVKAADNSIAGLRELVFGDPNPGFVDSARAERVFLVPGPESNAISRPANLDYEIANPLLIAWHDDHLKVDLYLSCLRERGPPLHPSFL